VALAALACHGCGASAANGGASAAGLQRGGNPDRNFADYAAKHGIPALGSHPKEPEVVAARLRLDARDKEKPVELDGVLGEWPALAKATTVLRGSPKSGLTISLQYDDAALYVAGEVTSASFVPGKDHVSLVLAVPIAGGIYVTREVDFYAGKPGESEGGVRLPGRVSVPGARIVEMTEAGGYSFEAMVPLKALGELRTTRAGVRGFAAYVDADGVIATGPADVNHPASMQWVPSEPELSMIEQLLEPKGLGAQPAIAEAIADLTGDGTRERIAVYGPYLTICGGTYLGGKTFFFRELAGELVALDTRNVTGRRGQDDILVRRRQTLGDASREYLEIFSAMNSADEPRLTFAHEIAVVRPPRRIDNWVHIARGQIEIGAEPPTNWDAFSYAEPIASDVEPILFPWGHVKSETYRFDGSRFAKVKEPQRKRRGSDG
jgi:hypothetical protein